MVATADLPQVLVIDDEMGPRESLRMLLKPSYQVHTADSVEIGLKLLNEKKPDAIVMDIRMPGITGIEGLRRIRQIDPHLSVIMLTGFGALETAKEALRLGANDYISKPFDAREMREVISRNVERTRLHRTSESAAGEIKELNNRLLAGTRAKGAARFPRPGFGGICPRHWKSPNDCLGLRPAPREKTRRIRSAPTTPTPSAPTRNWRSLNRTSGSAAICSPCGRAMVAWKPLPHKLISISDIVREVVAGVGAMAKETPVELKCDVTEDPCSFMGDAVQITRAIQNVIINAIQASGDRKGTVEVSCIRKDFYVDVRIADTGQGISSGANCEDFRSLLHDQARQERHRTRPFYHQESRR